MIVWKVSRGSSGPQDHRICPFVIFFLWGYLKNRVYTTRPRTLDELKQRIQDEIRGIPVEMLQRALGNLNGRMKECIRGGGRHLKRQVVMVQFLSIFFFVGFLQFLLGFSKVPFFCVSLNNPAASLGRTLGSGIFSLLLSSNFTIVEFLNTL